jgi:hypothetical protein
MDTPKKNILLLAKYSSIRHSARMKITRFETFLANAGLRCDRIH